MEQISIIGCGLMGSALIRTLAQQGNQLVIWNRTLEKAHALAQPGVTVATSFEQALAASPVVIFILADTAYAATTALLKQNQTLLAGKTIVQLSSGTPTDARTLSQFVTEQGGVYIDGGILAHPSMIGTEDALIFYSGNADAFAALEATFSSLGAPTFQGEDPGAAAGLDLALNVAATPTVVALLQGLKICQVENLPVQRYVDFIRGPFVEYLVHQVELGQQGPPANAGKAEETVGLMAQFTVLLTNYLRSLNIDAGMFDALARLYASGVASGRGDEDSLCVADLHVLS